jgi:PAS domain-containing protein
MKAGAWDYVIKEHVKRLGPAIESALDRQRVRMERKRSEAALRESEHRFATIFRNNPAAVAISEVDGRFVDVNDAWQELTGHARGEAVGRRASELSPWADPVSSVLRQQREPSA